MAETQNKVSHTPGPWSMTVLPHSVRVAIGEAEDGDEIRWKLYGGVDAFGDGIRIANARLIAGSPNLLEAAKRLVSHGKPSHRAGRLILEADVMALEEAIAAATGGAS